jgi:hypothetical protein
LRIKHFAAAQHAKLENYSLSPQRRQESDFLVAPNTLKANAEPLFQFRKKDRSNPQRGAIAAVGQLSEFKLEEKDPGDYALTHNARAWGMNQSEVQNLQ